MSVKKTVGTVMLTSGLASGVLVAGFALPASAELGEPYSSYVGPDTLETDGPVTVLLGQHGKAKSPIASPASINYYAVSLKAGQFDRAEDRDGGVSGEKEVVPNIVGHQQRGESRRMPNHVGRSRKRTQCLHHLAHDQK